MKQEAGPYRRILAWLSEHLFPARACSWSRITALSEISLSPDTVLQLASNFPTRLDAAGHVMVDSPAGSCQIHTLWVDGPRRGHGLARDLMAEAEATARRRGCRLVMGLTYDVLTRGFYDRLGYQTVGIIEDCPAGTTTRWYRKDL
jgi:ribosomal protein S18 acetylase RimI-like enzyme